MCSRAFCTVLPCGSSTAFFGVTIIFAFIETRDLPVRKFSPHLEAEPAGKREDFEQTRRGWRSLETCDSEFATAISLAPQRSAGRGPGRGAAPKTTQFNLVTLDSRVKHLLSPTLSSGFARRKGRPILVCRPSRRFSKKITAGRRYNLAAISQPLKFFASRFGRET